MIINGQIKNDVVVLDDNVALPEGARVTVVVAAKPNTEHDTMSKEQLRRFHEALARIDALPDEIPGDTFSGADHDRVL